MANMKIWPSRLCQIDFTSANAQGLALHLCLQHIQSSHTVQILQADLCQALSMAELDALCAAQDSFLFTHAPQLMASLQVTVNNQIVVGTLMNICDDPNRVSIYQVWRDSDLIERVPIIVTGNDLSHMFAPLVRDGRMSKFYWKPDRNDLSHILHQMYQVSL